MAEPINDVGPDIYLAPAVEVNREVVDPLGAFQDPVEPVIICVGGC